MPRLPLFILITACLLVLSAAGSPPPSQAQTGDLYLRAARLGVAHITHPSIEDPSERYGNALLIGAGWHRYPIYWSDIERPNGERVWDSFDRMVREDVHYGLKTDMILLNAPAHRRDGGSIANLFAPVFADGTDTPAPGKALNPANYWGSFVAEAVRRYMPGGILARLEGWSGDQGVRVWEAWNEPDLTMFWQGSAVEYARLLKVTYLTARQVDPGARVMTSGFAYQFPESDNWLKKVLDVYAADPEAPANSWYMDMVALHTYVDPYRSARVVNVAQEALARRGLERPIWLNETGVPVWDDYPGETWTLGLPGARQYRRTMREQAQYVIQSTTMGWAAGADVIFVHQLYDDCAASPVGTTFPPHNGELCFGLGEDEQNLCTGEAFGLFRNTRGAECFNQHPQAGTARPAASAYYRLASIFGNISFAYVGQVELNGWGRALVFDAAAPLTGVAYDPARIGLNDAQALFGSVSQRIWVMWNWSTVDYDLEIPAAGSSARLYTLTDDYRLGPENGIYTITLPKVRESDYPPFTSTELELIDGEPYILVEQAAPGWLPGEPMVNMRGVGLLTASTPAPEPTDDAVEATEQVENAAGIPTPIPTSPPTLDPALDTTPPVPRMAALPPVSPARFLLAWTAEDDSGIAEYVVWVRVDGGEWQPWMQTRDEFAAFTGSAGVFYEFALWAVDLAGNWSTNIDLSPMTSTRVE
ncbi:MAG: hypothetical protein JNL42_12325 [Anaerolineae bacterium]|nr:hypothetical protein [Anaerolineae bacterium]